MPTVCAAGAKLAWHGVLLTVALVATAAQEWRANARTDEAVGRLEGDGEVSETSTGTRIVDRTGEGSSAEEALGEMADQLGREVETSKDGKTQYIRLPGGGTASSRPTSSGGDPTVQVNRPGHRPTKVRFDNP